MHDIQTKQFELIRRANDLDSEVKRDLVKMEKALSHKISEGRCFNRIDQCIRIAKDEMFVALA